MSYGLYSLYHDKVDILNVVPGGVTTKLINNMDNALTCTPEVCVKNSLTSLGHDFENVPYLAHHVNVQQFYFFHRFLPDLWRGMLCKIIRTMALEEYKEKVDNEAKKHQ